MKKRRIFLVAFSAMTLGFSGCATLQSGGVQSVKLRTSDGEQAEATVMSASGAQEVTLPTTITVKRANVPLVVNVKETNTTNAGSYSQASKIDREFFSNNPGFLVGLLSSTTDVISGSMWTYDENITVPVTRK